MFILDDRETGNSKQMKSSSSTLPFSSREEIATNFVSKLSFEKFFK